MKIEQFIDILIELNTKENIYAKKTDEQSEFKGF